MASALGSVFNRRELLLRAAAGAGLMFLPSLPWPKAHGSGYSEDPHFFLHLYLFGGADPSYLFDARPLSMTASGKIQNYVGREPRIWTGRNGHCLASPLTHPLAPFKDRFSVINGVVMAHDFAGHPQNLNFMYTGNVFGGESFIPHLNIPSGGMPPTPLDAVQTGLLFLSLTNAARIVPLDVDTTRALINVLSSSNPIVPGDELTEHLQARMHANAKGAGRFSAAAREMSEGFETAPGLAKKFLSLTPPDGNLESESQFVSLIGEYFKSGTSRSAIWSLLEPFDVHPAEAAKKQPESFDRCINRIAKVFRALCDTPYDDRRSLMDVTTVMVATEFGRTFRQLDAPSIDETGTDHNPLTNCILLGGKGIRGGDVIGATDLQNEWAPISKAHLLFDSDFNMPMARPFDFQTMRPTSDLPERFDLSHYLTMGSVANTIYSLFNVPYSRYRQLSRTGPTAPVLSSLLA